MSNEEQTPVSEEAPEPTPVAPTPVAPKRKATQPRDSDRIHGLGRRKTAVARVFLRPGEGLWKVNGRTLEEYFPRGILQQSVSRPLAVTETQGQFDVFVRVRGGGLHGQADAVRLGLARALLKVDEDYRSRLRGEELLTRDAREVERKKPGRPKARKRFQFSKR
ncbi:MAG: 30S ribosomal protein S9 [Gemmatimonas sp.]|nr:30S ribosomal protein S9 [Gemmatimonas sp.]